MLTNKEIQIYGPLQKLKILYEGFPHPPIVTLDEGLALAETGHADLAALLLVGPFWGGTQKEAVLPVSPC